MPGIFIEPDDACVYVTEACNSNCIMCPMSRASRKRGQTMSDDQWDQLGELIPEETRHITITGGEPFLEYEKLFTAMQTINESFPHSQILVLTNGRALALPTIRKRLVPLITEQYCFAIPIHAADPLLHDQITGSPGSFNQSMAGLEFLSTTKARIEVRIVAHSKNIFQLNNTFEMLANTCSKISVINLVGMEMSGCAAANRNELWIDYQTICSVVDILDNSKAINSEDVSTVIEGFVWISANGIKYHSSPTCSNMKSPTKVHLLEALENNHEPCGKCYR